MQKVVVFRECVLTESDFVSRLDDLLAKVNETLQVFDGKIGYAWNERRDRLIIRSHLFTAEIMYLTRKGVVVMVNLSLVAYPFRRQIEDRIRRALDSVFPSKGEASC